MSNETKDESDMTLEDRVEWLRERGVLIETPEERKRQQVEKVINQIDETKTEETISFVLIPADTSKPLQELSFEPKSISIPLNSSTAASGDLLLEHLKPIFQRMANGAVVDIELLKKYTTSTTFSTSLPNLPNGSPTVSDTTLQQVAAQANVEVFSLVKPLPTNKFTGINIYLDEVGMLKRLPINKRASDYAYQAGYNPPPTFYGDVFMGRVQTLPKYQNKSFVLGYDTAPDAPWLISATQDNLTYQLELNSITGQTNATQPNVAGQDGIAKTEDGYSWTQSESELEIIVPLPADATSKDVAVKFVSNKVQVHYQTNPQLLLQLFERVDTDSCTWTLEKSKNDSSNTNKRLIISMEKQESALWPRIED